MAKMETKVDQVAPDGANAMIALRERFGWLVISSQEVVDNYLSTSGDTQYQNRTKYTKITLQRDKEMPNYERIKQLEAEYEGISYPEYVPCKKTKKGAYIALIVADIVFIIAMLATCFAANLDMATMISSIFGGIVLLVASVLWIMRSKKKIAAATAQNKIIAEKREKLSQRIDDIYKEADELQK